MPIKVSWLVAERVLLLSAWDAVTVDDLQDADQEVAMRLADLPTLLRVHLMMDYTAATVLPPIHNFQHAAWIKNAHLDWLLVIADNTFGRFFGNLIGRVTGLNFRLVETRAEAYDILAEIDPSILNQLLE